MQIVQHTQKNNKKTFIHDVTLALQDGSCRRRTDVIVNPCI